MSKRIQNKSEENMEFLDLYASLDGWTEKEAVLLSLCIDPRNPFEGLDRKIIFNINDIPSYKNRLFMLLRAVVAFGWDGYVLPKDFIVWAELKNISVPERLKIAVNKAQTGGSFVFRQQNENAIEIKEKTYAEEIQLEENARELAEYRERKWNEIRQKHIETEAEKVNPKARTSMLKMIFGMAVDKYRYQSNAKICHSASKIQSAVERAGMEIDVDTVRNWLRESAALAMEPK
ncbi:hypothetical protein ABFZ85_08950 [Hyphococcus formosus]|uniref:hypothetical protein n=1 Tax=Hyphococcus formosus TaxID=3143534 RepID=UPI00398B50E2